MEEGSDWNREWGSKWGSKWHNGTLNGILNSKQKDVLVFIAKAPRVQAQEIIDRLSIPRDTLNKILKVLTDRELIERRGSKKTGGYYVIEKK